MSEATTDSTKIPSKRTKSKKRRADSNTENMSKNSNKVPAINGKLIENMYIFNGTLNYSPTVTFLNDQIKLMPQRVIRPKAVANFALIGSNQQDRLIIIFKQNTNVTILQLMIAAESNQLIHYIQALTNLGYENDKNLMLLSFLEIETEFYRHAYYQIKQHQVSN